MSLTFEETHRRNLDPYWSPLRIVGIFAPALTGLPEEVADDGAAFCCDCHAEVLPDKESESVDYSTNSGGTWYVSPCCGGDVYRSRQVLWLSPGRPPRYLYHPSSQLVWDGPGDWGLLH